MADILNLPNCGGSTSTFNSGAPLCDIIRKQLKALYLADAGVEFPASDRVSIAAFVASLKTKTRGPRGGRVYPILELTNYEDTSKEAQKGTVGNLSNGEIILNDPIPSFKFEHRKGDLFHQQLSAAQNANLKLFMLDSSYVMYGTGDNFTGLSLSEFYAELAKFATASEPSKYPFSVTLASLTEYKENLRFIQLDSTVLNVKGNIDVSLGKVSQAANVINVSVTGRGGTNLGTLYPTEIGAGAAWVITNAQTGANVVVSSATYNATLGHFVVTSDSAAYTALTTGQIFNVNLVSAAALSALGVDGFESTGAVQIIRA